MKKSSLLMSLVLLFWTAFFSLNAYAGQSTGETFKKGTWGEDLQGIRFSIYDTNACKTVAVLDMFKGDTYNSDPRNPVPNSPYYQFVTRIVNSRRATLINCGSKLDYLYQYKFETDMDIKDIQLSNDQSIWKYSCVSSSEAFSRYLKTVIALGSEWSIYVDVDSFKEILLNHKALVDISILRTMGFTLYSSGLNEGYRLFDDSYVLVIEPTYYFLIGIGNNKYDLNGFYFYGTATEYAIWDAQMDGRSFWNMGGSTDEYWSGPLWQIMGLLTHHAGPSGIMPQEDKLFLLDGAEPEEDGSIPDGTRYLEITSPNNHIIAQSEYYRNNIEVDRKILEQYGVETMIKPDFDELTVDIVTENTTFRTGTEGIISFRIVSAGVSDFIPSYSDMIATPNSYYGLKLVLETLNTSTGGGRYMPSEMEILSDGLPRSTIGTLEIPVQVDTLAYRSFSVPNSPGEWDFSLDVYSSLRGKEDYASTTGEFDDLLGSYRFSIKFEKSPVSRPPDASALDLMPSGFSNWECDISALALSNPVVSRSWSYYKASAYVDIDGEATVFMDRITETARARIGDSYAPICYENIPLKHKDRLLQTRSGYGIGLEVPIEESGSSGYQSGTALYPEFNYTNYGETLEKKGSVFRLECNPYSMYYNEIVHEDYSRVHFTPIWYPDGYYDIAVFLYDNWTPAGQLWDFRSYRVKISGTIYDDWYITRR